VQDNSASPKTLAALERIKDRLRIADEFTSQMAVSVQAPRRTNAAYSWTLQMIREARDAQLRGDFQRPVALAAAMKTDDALFTAYHNRIAPTAAIATELVPAAEVTRAENLCRKAASSVIVPRPVLQQIVGRLADHGIAIGYVLHEPSRDGTRIDFRLTEWPLEFVKWNPDKCSLETRIEGGPNELIQHGNSRWVVFRKFQDDPWKQEACILPGALVWASHANGIKDWALASTSHGLAKVIGKLPAGWALRDASGKLTAEAQAFIDMLQSMAAGENSAGVGPAGSEVEFLNNSSTAWQVFKELILDRTKAAARIYLGTDATLGSQGGGPGIDIATLFGVATTKIQGDFQAIEDGLRVGVYEPWAAINDGDSRNAPQFKFKMPDPDKAAEQKAYDERLLAFHDAIKRHKSLGFVLTQKEVDEFAKAYDVKVPTLPAALPPAAPAPAPAPAPEPEPEAAPAPAAAA
jgi:phage gp29-like protein